MKTQGKVTHAPLCSSIWATFGDFKAFVNNVVSFWPNAQQCAT